MSEVLGRLDIVMQVWSRCGAGVQTGLGKNPALLWLIHIGVFVIVLSRSGLILK